MTATVPVTVYGASDDLVELDTPDRSIYEEYDCYGPTFVKLTAPDGATMVVRLEFGRPGPYEEWDVEVHEDNAGWKVEKARRPDNDIDPALIIHVPVGTVAENITEA